MRKERKLLRDLFGLGKSAQAVTEFAPWNDKLKLLERPDFRTIQIRLAVKSTTLESK